MYTPTFTDPTAYAWRTACQLYTRVTHDAGLPDPVPSPLPLQPGESAHGDLCVEFTRYYGCDVEYVQTSIAAVGSPGFVFGAMLANDIANARAARAAEAAAAPQWRDHETVRCVVTDRRLLTQHTDGWTQWWYRPGVWDVSLHVESYPWFVELRFTDLDAPPLRLTGDWAPWIAALMAHQIYGPAAIPTLEDLSPLAPRVPSPTPTA